MLTAVHQKNKVLMGARSLSFFDEQQVVIALGTFSAGPAESGAQRFTYGTADERWSNNHGCSPIAL